MTIQTAERIISDYGRVLAKAVAPNFFMAKTQLPCSSARIKFAIYRYVVELIRLNKLTRENIEMLMVAYSHLSFFVVDERMAEMLNKITGQKDDPTPEYHKLVRQNKELIHLLAMQKESLSKEFQEYIQECLVNVAKEN
jgi:hypothetical protein